MADEDTRAPEPFKAPAAAPTPTPAPAPKPQDTLQAKSPAPAAAHAGGTGSSVAIKDIVGQDAGFTVELGPQGEAQEDDEQGTKALAARIKGWSNFYVDGAEYPYSEANAVNLLNRFGYIREQLAAAE